MRKYYEKCRSIIARIVSITRDSLKGIRYSHKIKKIEEEYLTHISNLEYKIDKINNEFNKYKEETDKEKEELSKRIKEMYYSDEVQKHIGHIITSNIELDTHTFNKRMQLANLRTTKDLSAIMRNFTKLVDMVADNYLINKYLTPNANGTYKRIDVYKKDRLNDLNNIYDKFISIVNLSYIDEELGLFYDLYRLQTKEFLIALLVEPVYTPKMNKILSEYGKFVENLSKMNSNDFSVIFEDEVHEKTDLENTIDSIYNSIK